MLGVLLVALKYLEAGPSSDFQLRIGRGGYEHGLKGPIDRLVIGDLVFRIGLVEFRPAQLSARFFLARLLNSALLVAFPRA